MNFRKRYSFIYALKKSPNLIASCTLFHGFYYQQDYGVAIWVLLLLRPSRFRSLQSCPTLCDPIDSSPPGSPVLGILQARTLEWVAISFSNIWALAKLYCNTAYVQFSSVAQSCPTVCDPMNCSMPGLPVHHQLPEFTQTHAHRVGDTIQPSHPLSSPSPPAPNPSQHQSLFSMSHSSHEVAKVLEFQLQHQSFQWTPRTDLL